MKNVQKQLWLLLAAAAAFIIWTVTNAVFYGVFRPRADSLVMLGFWLFALTRAYRIGMGMKPFPKFQAWLEQCPGLTEAEYAAAVAAKKAKAQAPTVLASETKAAPVNAAAEAPVESCDSDAPAPSEPEASEPAAEPDQEEEDEVTEEETSENEESPDENLEDLM